MPLSLLRPTDTGPERAGDRFVYNGNALTWAWDYATLEPLGLTESDARPVHWTTIRHLQQQCGTAADADFPQEYFAPGDAPVPKS